MIAPRERIPERPGRPRSESGRSDGKHPLGLPRHARSIVGVNGIVRASIHTVAVLLALVTAACLGPRDRGAVHFTEPASTRVEGPLPHWPVHPDEAASLLEDAPVESIDVMSRRNAGAGVTGAAKIRAHFSEPPVELVIKWKELPRRTLDGPNNSPRKEIAAWRLQRLFLDAEDYVVPPSAMRCPPLALYREEFLAPDAAPTLDGVDSVCGLVSLWIYDVGVPDVVYDPQRFRRDPTYAYFLSNFNLLTYLIAHKDGRSGNILVSDDDARRQVFAIDNGIAFGGLIFNYLVPNWNVVRIPAVRKASVERLRRLRREDLDFLVVLYEFRLDDRGDLDRAEPGPPLDPDRGAVFRDGTLQLGLTRSEIDAVWERIQRLLADVDAGVLSTF